MLTTIEKIFSFSKKELRLQLLKFNDTQEYSNILELRNALIIQAFNNNQLNEKESKIVEDDKFDLIMKTNPENYNDFLEKLSNKFKSKINININPNHLKSWKYPKIIKTIDYKRKYLLASMYSNSKYIFITLVNNENEKCKIEIYDFKLNLVKKIQLKYGYSELNFSNENYLFIVDGEDGCNIEIFDLNYFNKIILIEVKSEINNIFVNKNFLFVKNFGEILIYNLQTFELIETIKFQSDSSIIVNDNYLFGSFDEKLNKIKIIDLETFKEKQILHTDKEDINSLLLNDKFLVVTYSESYVVEFWDIQTFKLIKTIEIDNILNLHLYENYIFIEDDNIKIYDLKKFNLITTIVRFFDYSYYADKKILVNDEKLFIENADDNIKIYDLKKFNLIATIEIPYNKQNEILVNDEKIFIYTHQDNKLNIYEKN